MGRFFRFFPRAPWLKGWTGPVGIRACAGEGGSGGGQGGVGEVGGALVQGIGRPGVGFGPVLGWEVPEAAAPGWLGGRGRFLDIAHFQRPWWYYQVV